MSMQSGAETLKVKVDFSEKKGPVKPLHGVGQPPFYGLDFSMFRYLTDAGIPFSRLHDVGGWFGGSMFVDIPNLFPDFGKDPADPASYDFTFTDMLISALMEASFEPVFRLGVSIENFVEIKAYRVFPPADSLKWAKICEGVIRHYTEGWAGGFYHKIRYWEIWNEPDNEEDPLKNPMWRGTMEQYFELYGTASRYLKNRFPHLKIGGYASCGFYAVAGIETDPNAKATAREEYFVEYFEKFLEYVKTNGCPLDFFSWHSYASIENTAIFAKYARRKLDEYGFTETETTCNEWNCEVFLRGTARHAAVTAAMMLSFQHLPVDSAMFYDARLGPSVYGSLFNPMTREPLPSYEAFLAFNELYKRGAETGLTFEGAAAGIYGAASFEEGKGGAIVIANVSPSEIALEYCSGGRNVVSYRLLTEEGLRAEAPCSGLPATLPGNSILTVITE